MAKIVQTLTRASNEYEQLLQEDLDSGEPLSLPQNAYSLIG